VINILLFDPACPLTQAQLQGQKDSLEYKNSLLKDQREDVSEGTNLKRFDQSLENPE
jgi:hypothetical protein